MTPRSTASPRSNERLGGRAQLRFAVSDQALQGAGIGSMLNEQAAIRARFIGSRKPQLGAMPGGKPICGKPQSILRQEYALF